MKKNLRISLRVVFYKDGADWVAHCLEFDLMGDGATKEQALDMLVEAMSLQLEASLEHDNPRNLFKPADSTVFEKFAAGNDVAVGHVHLKFDSVTIDDTTTREYVENGIADACLATF